MIRNRREVRLRIEVSFFLEGMTARAILIFIYIHYVCMHVSNLHTLCM